MNITSTKFLHLGNRDDEDGDPNEIDEGHFATDSGEDVEGNDMDGTDEKHEDSTLQLEKY